MGGFLILIVVVAVACAAIFFPAASTRVERRGGWPGLLGRSKFAELITRFRHKTLFVCSRFVRSISRITYKDLSSLRSFSDLGNYFKTQLLFEADSCNSSDQHKEPDLGILNCRIQQTIQKENNSVVDALGVEICGSIHAPGDMHHTTLRISIQDVTEGPDAPKPVQSRVKQWQALAPSGTAQAAGSSDFSYSADLGRLPHRVTTLSDWTAVAKLRVDWLVFPRKGTRNLHFNISILSAKGSQELACARCSYLYDNPAFGYIDLRENIEHTKTLAVALAFAVSAADNKMYDCEIELIKKWAKDNIDSSRASDKAERKLDKALNEVIAFFREGNKLNSFEICREIVEIAPAAQRYDILELCLHVAKANGSVVTEELELLRTLVHWLEIDSEKFRSMMDKVIPVEMYEVKDIESILGVTSDMSEEKARKHLNKEYSKWNARVTNTDPEIQSQADQMLNLIAEARTQYVQTNLSVQNEKKTSVHQGNTK